MAAMVLLRHDLPDGSWHWDWMIDRGDSGALLTFRVLTRIDSEGCGPFDAERLLDHRREYLVYEGEVSAGRGRVRREAVGEVLSIAEHTGTLSLRVDWGFGVCTLRGWEVQGGRWRFEFVAQHT